MEDKLEIKVALKLKSSGNSPSKFEKITSNTISLYGYKYKFNKIFSQNECPFQIYEETMKVYLENFMNGFNSLIIVYGPESNGKKETLGSIFFSDKKFSQRGIIPNFLIDLFTKIEEEKTINNNLEFCVFIDIIEIIDDKDSYGCTKSNLLKINNFCDAIDFIEMKTPRYTNSHLILKLKLDKCLSKQTMFSSEINFVDLAGWKREQSSSNQLFDVKWDLMMFEQFICAKLNGKTQSQPNNELCAYFNKMLAQNPKILLLICQDPAHPCINSVVFGNRLYQDDEQFDFKFINNDKIKTFSNDDTIEW